MEHNTENTQQDAQGQNGADKAPQKKKRCKKICKVVLIVLGVFLAVEVVLAVITWPYYKRDMLARREFINEMTKIENDLKADTYGGSTPEETYNMFRDAMINKDIETALLYVDIVRRENAKEFFNEKINRNELDDYIENDLPSLENMKKSEENKYVYLTYQKYVLPFTIKENGKELQAGDFMGSFSFQLIQSPYTKKWKIVNP